MRILVGSIIVCLLGSCASSNGVFMKRKYNRGYYFSLAAHKKDIPTNKTSSSQGAITVNEQNNSFAPSTPNVFDANIEPIPLIAQSNANMPTSESLFHGVSVPKKINYQQQGQTTTFKSKLNHKFEQQTKHASDIAAGAKFVVYFVLFLVLTLVYTLVFIANNPGIPLGLAIIVAMLGALLTLLTGQLFI